jgi:thiamine pyridinylase
MRRLGVQAAATAALLAGSLTAGGAAQADDLTVALYPWVPRLEQFQTAITDAWAAVQPDVTLTFVPTDQWDGGYHDDPAADWDVFVFDGMYFEYFRSQGYLEAMAPSEIADADDLLDYARSGVQSGGQYYAIPLLGCANILFYQQSDPILAAATTLSEVEAALGQCTYTSEVPPDRRGLMIDMSGSTTAASLYLDTAHAIDGVYPPVLPDGAGGLNPTALGNMTGMMSVASYRNAFGSEDGDYYWRAGWFDQGFSRAYVGYTESMSTLSDATRATIAFKVMPLSDDDQRPFFYADVIGVRAGTDQRALAVQLANVMAASDTVVASIGATGTEPVPQYLMAARTSVFETLEQQFPLYTDMYALVTDNDPLMYKLPATGTWGGTTVSARDWIADAAPVIQGDAAAGYTCGCDVDATQSIPDNSQASAICGTTCADFGGWSGQWTNAYPAAQSGSVCGCNACPAVTAAAE